MGPLKLFSAVFLAWCFLSIYSAEAGEVDARPAVFIENRGQLADMHGRLRPEILYTAESRNMKLFFTRTGMSYVIAEYLTGPKPTTRNRSVMMQYETHHLRTVRIDMRFEGANTNAEVVPEDQSQEQFNYYYAHCPDGIMGIRSYKKILYRSIYDRIDLVFYLNDKGLKYDFYVRPGGRPEQIRLKYTGADDLQLTPQGALHITTPLGEIVEQAPFSFQSTGAVNRETVKTRFILEDDEIGFDVGSHNLLLDLVIDPEVSWSTFLGGQDGDMVTDGVVDKEDNIILSGATASINFPTMPGVLQILHTGSHDAFAAKFDSDGRLVWATYFGGSKHETNTCFGGVTIDRIGGITVTGCTTSDDFPVTSNAFQQTYMGGGTDVFIFRLNGRGQRIWSTYYGGKNSDHSFGIKSDAGGNIYICGETRSLDFPVSANAFQKSYGGAITDAFLIKLDSTGQQQWSTYFGGGGAGYGYRNGNGYEYEYGFDIAIDSSGDIIMAGMTGSSNCPVTLGAFQTTYGGGEGDFLIAKFTGGGSLLWSTFYGGDQSDEASGVVVDRDNNIFITGTSQSKKFPVSANAYQREPASPSSKWYDCAVVKFTDDGGRLWATLYGGTGDEATRKAVVGADNNLYFAALTTSNDFPIVGKLLQPAQAGNGDGAVVRMSPDGIPVWSTYYGGSQYDDAMALTFDSEDHLIMVGVTASTDFPVTPNAFQRNYGGGRYDAFILKLSPGIVPVPDIAATEPATFYKDAGVHITDTSSWSGGPVLQSTNMECGQSYMVLLDTAVSIATVTLIAEKSENVQMSYEGTLPDTMLQIRIDLVNNTEWGHYAVEAMDRSGRKEQFTGVVRPIPPVPQISWDGRKLRSTPGSKYQWLYDNNELYNGTEQEYAAAMSGRYRVRVIDSSGCTRTSEEFELAITWVAEDPGGDLRLYPNPAGDYLVIESPSLQAGTWIVVRNMLGMTMVQQQAAGNREVLSIEKLPAGTYFVDIRSGSATITRKFIRR